MGPACIQGAAVGRPLRHRRPLLADSEEDRINVVFAIINNGHTNDRFITVWLSSDQINKRIPPFEFGAHKMIGQHSQPFNYHYFILLRKYLIFLSLNR